MSVESKVYRARATMERALAEELRTMTDPEALLEASRAELRAVALDRMADALEA